MNQRRNVEISDEGPIQSTYRVEEAGAIHKEELEDVRCVEESVRAESLGRRPAEDRAEDVDSDRGEGTVEELGHGVGLWEIQIGGRKCRVAMFQGVVDMIGVGEARAEDKWRRQRTR